MTKTFNHDKYSLVSSCY